MLLHNILTQWADQTPNKTALIQNNQKRSYQELKLRSGRLAQAMSDKLGVKKGDPVAVLSSNCIEMVELLFAISRIGAILVPLNIRLTTKELSYIIKDSGATFLCYREEQKEMAQSLAAEPSSITLMQLDGDSKEGIPIQKELIQWSPVWLENKSTTVSSSDPLMLIYTSGTTGSPKGAILSHDNNLWNCVTGAQLIEITSQDVSITLLPLFHIGGWGLFLLPTLFQGATTLILDNFDVKETFELCREHKVSIFMGVPTIYNEIRLSPLFKSQRLDSVRIFCSGGAPCPESLIKLYHDAGYSFTQGFGMSETSPIALLMREADSKVKIGSAGKPGICLEAQIVDDQMNELSHNEIGELVMRGNVICQGYWNKPEATKDAFRGGWFHSGDLAYKDREGFYYIVDRKKDMLISGGENVYPAEVEATLYQHSAIAEVSVIGAPHPKWGEVPVAITVTKQGVSVTEEELKSWVQDKLARFKQPNSYHFVDSLPKTASGKILKRELKDQFTMEIA
ncbi:MAG: long-chain fatty acid--CoA ligase [Proteobacteria bacterium]|nr:long-chain fatty acid--CoA ligase [Pseudomonadota bacterium]